MISCNHDCFNCPYPDVPDECLSASLTYDEYKESDQLDSEIRYEQKTNAQKKVYAKKKAYREANREKIAARNKAYYEANQEKMIAWQNAYNKANKEKIAARQKAWHEANRDKLADKQSCIRTVRKSHGMRQSDLAQLVGVSQRAISAWELGTLPANWDKLCAVLPELKEYRP